MPGCFKYVAPFAVLVALLIRADADQPTTAPAAPAADQATLEREFQRSLTGVVLRGTWQMTGAEGLAGKAALGAARSERYAIVSAEKADADNWLITARIQFGEYDAAMPVMVKVRWAGDTAVITVDDMKFLTLGPYSARVMIYRGFYAGTWRGPTYGGVMSGQIINAADEARVTTQPATQPARP